jgi:hypothetical protein
VSTVSDVALAIQVLVPLVEQTVAYLRGGPEPEFMATLPVVLKSRIALEARKARTS